MTRYDNIGHSYAKTRRPDLRIAAAIIDLLELPRGSALADVGVVFSYWRREAEIPEIEKVEK